MKPLVSWALVILLQLAEQPCFAYQCRLPPLADSFSGYTHVFSGKVIEFHRAEDFPFSPKSAAFYGSGADCVIVVKVDHSFRGTIPAEVKLRESSKDDLGVRLAVDDHYIFFVNLREDGGFTRTRCDPTTEWSRDTACELERLSGRPKGKKCAIVDAVSRSGYCGRKRLRLDGIISDGKSVRCIIDGDIYSKGDRIGGGRITGVDMNGVAVECDGKRIALSVSPK